MTVSLWQDTASWPGKVEHQQVTADICIVGAGVVGSMLAKLFGEAGKSVVVLEAHQVASGASGRNAGHCVGGLRTNYHQAIERWGHDRARDFRRYLIESRDLVWDYCQRYDVPFERNGSRYLSADEAEAAQIRASALALQADGEDVEYSDGDPWDRGFAGTLFQAGDIGLQPYLLVTHLMADSGALVIENSEVRAIEQRGDKVILRSKRATVECGQAILATNAYSRILHPYFRDKVFPTRAQAYATEPSSERLFDGPTGTEDGFEYFRQLPDGRFLIGGYRDRFIEEEVGFADETTPHLQAGLESWVAARFPEVARLKITHRWAGIMGFTSDSLPLVGTLPDMPKVAFAVGFNGGGMSMGPATARLTADYVLTGAKPDPLHVDRLTS